VTLPGWGEDQSARGRIPVLYLAPWVDFGGSDKGTIDWFRWLDRDRFAPSLITTQPSPNRRLGEVHPYANEVWSLPDCMAGHQFPRFIFDFIHTRRIQVLHIMNSRIGFELLPDLGCLERPPAVVVQLHVEEPDRSGYVRYVTTRYGNLVDGFSVSSGHLAAAMRDYDVSRQRIHVIPTGVDAGGEFNPARVSPLVHSDPTGAFRILFAGRLAEQKDPLLMVEVVKRLLAEREQVRIDIVGEGPFEAEIRKRLAAHIAASRVSLHPPTTDIAPWLAATDLLLMTSVFEGVPYVVYEAMAMAVPVVAPALAGTVELIEPTGGVLIDPRDDVDAYVAAILLLIDDEAGRRSLGERGRTRALEEFSLRQMAAGHEQLYEVLLAKVPGRAPAQEPVPASPLCFPERPARGTPLVSVVTPCYEHGGYLPTLLESIRAQDYPAIEWIIVDDGSTDPDTVATLEALGGEPGVRVYQQPQNRGPSAARNRAIAEAQGRYILPVDADNLLEPGAVTSLVSQLTAAGEHIGFIYPASQYFGNRDYHFQPPAYNLHRLLEGNYIDTCSLLDREIFDAGLAYAEDIQLGHEDWDLALELAARGVIGQPSLRTVIRYRKHGFTRSDKVEFLRLPFREEIRSRHPQLFGSPQEIGSFGRYTGPGLRVKARWAPALSLIALEPTEFACEHGGNLLRSLEAQTCGDVEFITECSAKPHSVNAVIRRLPPDLASGPAARVQDAIEVSRGRFLAFTDAPAALLDDRALVEKVVRGFAGDPELQAIVVTDVGPERGAYPWALLPQVDPCLRAHTVFWRRELTVPLGRVVELLSDDVADQFARFVHRQVSAVQWRHVPIGTAPRHDVEREVVRFDLGRRPPPSAHAKAFEAEQRDRLDAQPAIPTMPADRVPRWGDWQQWAPPECIPLARHVMPGTERRVITNDRQPPPGFVNEMNLGSIRQFSPPGTRRLIGRSDGSLITVPRGAPQPDDEQPYGYLEEARLPLWIGIECAVLPDGTQTLVIADARDPLRARATRLTFLGFIEGFPVEPLGQPDFAVRIGEPVLLRWVDRASRRHRYVTVASPERPGHDRPIGAELGRLLPTPGVRTLPLYIDEAGRVSTDHHRHEPRSASAEEIARWVLAPLAWRRFSSPSSRARSVARRALDIEHVVAAQALRAARSRLPVRLAGARQRGRLVGYLRSEPEPGMVALYSARHPVIDDQFLSHHAIEATDMGYVDVGLLGFLEGAAPITGKLGSHRAPIPWVSRFGLAARNSWNA
jgi:glycosyltransferase involved in cell wall biosynthesis